MTDRIDKNAKLLAETFHEDWATGRAAGYAMAAAAQVRRRRRIRAALATSGVAVAIALTAILTAHRRLSPVPATLNVAVNRTAPQPNPRGYEIISDDQLIAQLHDRPLLVVQKKNGTRQIVLLEDERSD